MKHRTVTVFVRRIGGQFHANTHIADAFAMSATIAARKCAARHFGVEDAAVELLPDGENVLIASVGRRAPARDWPLLVAALVCTGAGFACWWWLIGGAR